MANTFCSFVTSLHKLFSQTENVFFFHTLQYKLTVLNKKKENFKKFIILFINGKNFLYFERKKQAIFFFVFPIFPFYCAVDKKHTDKIPAIAICPVNRISRRSAMELATDM